MVITPKDPSWNEHFFANHVGKRAILYFNGAGQPEEGTISMNYTKNEIMFGDWYLMDSLEFFNSIDIPELSLHEPAPDTWRIPSYYVDTPEDEEELSYYGFACHEEMEKAKEKFEKDFIKSNTKKMSEVIKEMFKSEETKALEYFDLGTKGELNGDGLGEFLSFLWETADKETKKSFLKLVVKKYKEARKCR